VLIIYLLCLYYRNFVWNGYDAVSEVANVSARHVVLRHQMVADKR